MCQSGGSVSIKIKMNAALQHVKNYIYCRGPEVCHHVRYGGYGKWFNTVYQIIRKKFKHSKSKETSPNYFHKVVSTIVKKQKKLCDEDFPYWKQRGNEKLYQSKTTHMVVTYISPYIFKLWSLLKGRQQTEMAANKGERCDKHHSSWSVSKPLTYSNTPYLALYCISNAILILIYG